MQFNKIKTQVGTYCNTPLLKITFIFLDLETTGLHPQYGDRICEIGLLKAKNGKIIDSYETLINPCRPISPGAFNVNKITANMVKNAPLFSQIVNDFFDFIKGSVIVAHNAPFDLEFIGSHLHNLGIPFPNNFVIDTLTLARAHYNFPGNSLGKIASYFGIDTYNQHRALGDTKITKEIFYAFLKNFKDRGVNTLYDLLELQGGSFVFPTYGEIILPPEVEESVKSKKKLKLRYVSAEGEETVRTIEPIEIIPYQDYTYLIANCLLRGERRTFRLDRILEMEVIE
ncbi:WYL domain-containing protein [candidate division WOR-3 bacterium]|nr:WYL domain-containing protein [candidate division WOR-3 bacterium]